MNAKDACHDWFLEGGQVVGSHEYMQTERTIAGGLTLAPKRYFEVMPFGTSKIALLQNRISF